MVLSGLYSTQLLLFLLLRVVEVQIALLLLLLFLFLDLVPFEDIFLKNFFEVVLSFLFLEGKLLINTVGQLVHFLGRFILFSLALLSCTLHTYLIPL